MNKYRKILLGGLFGMMVLWFGGDWLMRTALDEPLAARHARTEKLLRDIHDQERNRDKSRQSEKTLEVLKRQSLPSNLEVARSQYQAWLLGLVEHVAFGNPNVDSSEPVHRSKQFHVLAFSLRGRGSLEQLTRFLYEFYSTDFLHQVRSLSIAPIQGTSELDLTISIEALALPQAEHKDRLNPRHATRLASVQLEDYQVVVQRNLFGVGDTTDPTYFTYLTSVNYVDGVPEAWFSVRTTDETMRLRQGEALEIGQFKGTIAEIIDSDVILESDGERWLMTVGENLGQASALPPEY